MWASYVSLVTLLLVTFSTKAEVYEWEAWDTWSSCSQSCGKGIETRQRRCFKASSASQQTKTNVHRRWCKGSTLEYRFCRVKECDNWKSLKVTYYDAYRIRAQQCTEFDKKSYNGKNINWKPYLRDHLDNCKLYCLASGHKFYARLKNFVRDGTPCGKDYSNVCIKGICQKRPRGCQSLDGPCVLEERKKILGVFNSTKLNLGYNLVATIPAGSTNISIEELTRSRSYLALKDHESGKYHLNGHWMISLSKTFRLASVDVTYVRNGNTRRGGELITADGPLDKSLDIMMIYQRDPSIIKYSYLVTKEEYKRLKQQSKSEGQNLYFPKHRENSPPTEQKQNDRKTQKDRHTQNGRQTVKEGESISFIAGQSQAPYPDTSGRQIQAPYPGTAGRQSKVPYPYLPRSGQRKVPANTGFRYPQLSAGVGGQQTQDGKQASWYGSSWVQFGGDESGSKQTSEPGTQFPGRPFLNKQTSKPGTQFARRPFLKQQVFKANPLRNSKPPQYQGGPQSGSRFDNSKRPDYQRAHWGRSQDRSWQNPLDPNVKKQFYTSNQEKNGGVTEYSWKIVGFTPCSSSCAGGIQSGIVKCTRSSTGEHVADIKCDQHARPQETRKVCNLRPCPASWVPQEWKSCSKTCGEGVQMRDLMCKQMIDRSGEKVPVMLPVVKCPEHLRPEVIRKCFVRECPVLAKPKWLAGSWSQCSVECGHGVQERLAICKNYRNETVEDSECFLAKKPPVIKACYHGLCKADWYVRTEWSQCSRTCGTGVRSRSVVCARIEGSKLAGNHCKDKSKPEHEQSCNTQLCKGIWVTSEWSKCSTGCGPGLQLRVVICMKSINGNYQETFDADCSLDDKPVVRKNCHSNCVPSWFATPWSQCSVSCGHGVETRYVSCLNGEGKRVGGCKAWERPQQRRACNLRACPGTKATIKPRSKCQDNPRLFKRYCHIIKRINYCRIASYRKKCCATCTAKPATILGHI